MDALPHLNDFEIDEQAILLGVLFDQMPMGVVIFDRNLIMQRCNPTWAAFSRQYGPRSLEKIRRGMHLYELMPGNQAALQPMIDHLLAGESVQQEALRLENDGRVSYWDIAALPILQGDQVQSLLIVSVDATQRILTIQELQTFTEFLRASEERLNLVLQATNDGIWDWDMQSGNIYYSDRWKSMLGYAEHEISPDLAGWRNLIHPDDIGRAEETLQAYQERRTPSYQLEHRLRHKDGTYRWFLARAMILWGKDGQALRMVGSHSDITEQKRVEEEIRRQNEFLAALHETTLGIISRLDSSELFEAIVERAVKLIGAAYGWLYVLAADRRTMVVQVGTGAYRRYTGLQLAPGEGLAGKIWLSSQSLAIDDYHTWPGRSLLFESDPIGPAVGAPIRSGSEVVGVLGLTRAQGAPVFHPAEIDLLSRLAQLVSIALDNARLHASLQAELGERIQMEAALRNRVVFEQLISEISSEFINLAPGEIDEGIYHTLQTLARFIQADRSHVFIFSEDGMRMDTVYEWCRPGVSSQSQRIQNQSTAVIPWIINRLKKLEVVNLSHLDELPPEAGQDRREYQEQSIRSLVLVPMAYQTQAIGMIGFDAVESERAWTEETITLLRVVGEIIVNALELKRSQAIQDGQRRFLELLATGGEFSITLHTLVQLIEKQWPGMLGLVLLLDEDGQHLHVGAANTLPQDYVESIENMQISPRADSCSVTCFTGQRVIVEDIALDPSWESRRALALKFGLRSCWAEPVYSADGQILGTFAMYYRQPRLPSKAELRTLETAAHLVGVAIQHKQAQEKLVQAYQTLEERVEERTRELAALNAISAVVSRSLNLREILSGALEKTLEVMQLELGLAYRVEPQEIEDSDAHVHLLATVGLTEEFERIAADLPLAGSTILKAAQLQQPYVWEVEQNPLPEIRLGLQRYGVALAVTAPLMVKDKLVGAIVLGTRQARSFTTDELALLAAISQQIGVAVENSRLREQAELSAAMAERNRLARELHDSVTQSLYTVTLYAEAANRMLAAEKNIEASQHLRELRNTAQEALREMRLLIFELRPLALEKIGLASALHMRLEAVESRGGIQTELKVRGVEKLPARLQEELYQVATEALNNLLKHAHAQCVTVQLNVDANRIVLEVCDDGIGFDPTAVETGGGFGIAGMKERAHRLGGQLQMISAPGQGTRVRLEAPNASPETANDPFPKWSKR